MTGLVNHGMDNVLSPAAVPPFVQSGSAPLDQNSFLNLAGYLADGSALRRSHNRLFYRDNVESSVLTTFASQYIKYPIIAPFLHLGVFNTDYSRFGLLILHNFSGAGDAELLAYSSRGLCWSRPAIRGIASWIFEKHDLRRVTLRPPLRPISYFSYQMQVATNIAI